MASFVATQFAALGAYFAEKVSPTTAKYILTFVLGGSGLSKFAPAQSMKEWPGLPLWFWYGCAVWELAATALMFTEHGELSRTLSYIFLGGVVASVTVLKSPSPKWFILPMPILTTGLLASLAHHEKRPFATHDVYALVGGFVFGVVVEQLGPAEKPAGKKK